MTHPFSWLLDTLWPTWCAACDRPASGRALCSACFADLDAGPSATERCTRCALPVGPVEPGCARCQVAPPRLDAMAALGSYTPNDGTGVLVRAVRALKYEGRRSLASDLGTLLAQHYPFDRTALIVPVPMHRDRLRLRGFNQAALLARTLARSAGLTYGLRVLVRTRPTRPQSELATRHDRFHNLAAAIAVRCPARVHGRPVVVIDDVITTGATATACARVLYDAGAQHVAAYAVGRTPL
jgi:ComF family protein